MNQTNPKEATISTSDFTLQLVEEWIETARIEDLSPGPSVSESLERALDARMKIDACGSFDLDDSIEAPELVHALCRILMEQCTESPRLVLREARVIRDSLKGRQWPFDTFSERDVLLCSLTLICWRASRLLNLTREGQQLWSEYGQYFRSSLDWEVAREEWGPIERWRSLQPDELQVLGPETVFRMLLQLQDELELDPQAVGVKALTIYRCLSDSVIFAPDWNSFFQGDSARLIGASLRLAGRYHEASSWLDNAESHFCSSADPDPQLARILFHRLTILHGLSQLEPILRVAPILDSRFGSLGMEEYRVKCGILWASALKLAGQPEAALLVLKRLRGSTSGSPQLLGWVLAEIGDNYGICGNHERGVEALEKAAYFLRKEKQLTGLAQVNSMIATILRSRGLLSEALRLFTMSISDYERLGMTTSAAYIRILVAETYLAMNLPRDAERAILKALPVLEDEKIGPESLVAFSILREAVRRQKLDPQMLRELRERLRPGSQ